VDYLQAAEATSLNFSKLSITTFGADSKGVLKPTGSATFDAKDGKQ
jgi:hypothetical protein